MRFYYSTDGSNWTQVREWTGLSSPSTNLGPYTTIYMEDILDLLLITNATTFAHNRRI